MTKPLSSFPPADVQSARERVAQAKEESARKILKENQYAPQVTQERKENNLILGFEIAEKIREGKLDHNFTVWQRIYMELTGECVAFLP